MLGLLGGTKTRKWSGQPLNLFSTDFSRSRRPRSTQPTLQYHATTLPRYPDPYPYPYPDPPPYPHPAHLSLSHRKPCCSSKILLLPHWLPTLPYSTTLCIALLLLSTLPTFTQPPPLFSVPTLQTSTTSLLTSLPDLSLSLGTLARRCRAKKTVSAPFLIPSSGFSALFLIASTSFSAQR